MSPEVKFKYVSLRTSTRFKSLSILWREPPAANSRKFLGGYDKTSLRGFLFAVHFIDTHILEIGVVTLRASVIPCWPQSYGPNDKD